MTAPAAGRLARFRRTREAPQQWAAVAWGALGIIAVMLIWELYKFLGPAEGVVVGAVSGQTGSGVMILPRTHDRAMPHIWDMAARLFESTSGEARRPCGSPSPRQRCSRWVSPPSAGSSASSSGRSSA